MTEPQRALVETIAAEADMPVDRDAAALIAALQARGGGRIAAILFYGSGLWQGPAAGAVLDFYVLVDRYRDFDDRAAAASLARLLPPNVYYLETTADGRRLRCKYAVMRLDQFARAASPRACTPQVWARFAQRCRLVHARDAAIRQRVIAALAEAVVTFHRRTLPLLDGVVTPRAVWCRGLGETYARELRSEPAKRAETVYDAAAASFDRRSALAAPLTGLPVTVEQDGRIRISVGPWARRRARLAARFARPLGKLVSLLRLMKATATFEGGVDYILWKVERHSGQRVEASKFQRRHPLLGGWPLLWRLYRRGGFR